MIRSTLCLTLALAFLPISQAEASAPSRPAVCDTSTIDDFNRSHDYVCLNYEGEKYIAYIGGVDYQHKYQLFVKKQKVGDRLWSPVGGNLPLAEGAKEVSLYVSEGVPYIAFTIFNDITYSTVKVMKHNVSYDRWENIPQLEDTYADSFWASKSIFVKGRDIYLAYKRSQESAIAVFKYNMDNTEKDYLQRISVGKGIDASESDNSVYSLYVYYKNNTIYVGSQTSVSFNEELTAVRQYDPEKKEWSITKAGGKEIKMYESSTRDYKGWINLFKEKHIMSEND